MIRRFVWTGTVVMGVLASLPLEANAAAVTNGVIVISTRTAVDALYRQISSSTLYDADDFKGPGVISPGDAAMASLLQDHGYVTRLVPEWLLRPEALDPTGVYQNLSPEYYYGGGGGPSRPNDTNVLFSASLVIISGSGSSSDMPPPNTNGIPIMMGEHSCLGDQALAGNSSIYMYGNKVSGNQTSTAIGPSQYMTVVAPNHPILQGIPLDSQNRVKIWRDPYPEENAHLPAEGSPKVNYKYSWTWVNTNQSTVAEGTLILGLQGDNAERAVFAVNPAGAPLANGTTDHPNYVHLFVNEHGSGDSRRAFNALTDIGKVIFIRTCKWAMGEKLEPYKPLGLIRVSQLGSQLIELAWQGTATKNYKVIGTQNLFGPADPSNWQTVAEDIAGVDGNVTVKFNVGNAPQYAFLRVVPVP